MPDATSILELPFPVPGDTVDVPRDIEALAQKLDPLGIVPVGSVLMWMTATPPINWLIMNGQQVSAVTYPVLATILGQVGGLVTIPDMRDRFPSGAGATALNSTGGASAVALSDPAQLPSHSHSVSALTASSAGSHAHAGTTGGSNQNIDHSHLSPASGYLLVTPNANVGVMSPPGGGGSGLNVPALGIAGSQSATISGATGGINGGHAAINHDHGFTTDSAGAHTHPVPAHSTNATGAAATHENRPPFRALNFIIRAG
jgi:microcystin-dependent protein